MSSSDVKISRLLSYVLRHKPEAIDLTLDKQGWVKIDDLIEKSKKVKLSRDAIFRVVKNSDKQRFIISEDEDYIRANQGHSIKVDLGLIPTSPPDLLFHGTATRFLEAILSQGLQKMNRHHVHLSTDEETAAKVGLRHGKLQILVIDSLAMNKAGHVFYVSENGVWLTDHVPQEFIKTL